MTTIKEVAKLAGVSPSTVSRTLSGRIFVEEGTRQKVLKAVAELNYQPSGLARGLREGKTQMLGFLVPDINSLFYPMMMKSIERCASEQGYSLILCNNDEKIENEKSNMAMMAARGIDGLLCMSVEDDVRHLVEFQRGRGIPVILVNRTTTDQVTSVSFDNEYGGYTMTKYLLERGHTKIAAMVGGLGQQRFRARLSGCRRAMEEYGVKDYDRYFIYEVDSIETAFQRTKEILAGTDRPTAFFATMDMLAIGIYSGVSHSGFRIPDDVSVVGFDDVFMSQYMIPPLTTYRTPVDDVARESIACLVAQLKDPAAIRKVDLKGELIERQSVRRLGLSSKKTDRGL